MRRTSRLCVLLAALLALPAAEPARQDGKKIEKARLKLRAMPTVGFAPTEVHFTAEVTGGEGRVEELYCPELEWSWGDGSRSAYAPDCPPFEERLEMQRRFQAEHFFRRSGIYTVQLRLKRNRRILLSNTVKVTLKAGMPR